MDSVLHILIGIHSNRLLLICIHLIDFLCKKLYFIFKGSSKWLFWSNPFLLSIRLGINNHFSYSEIFFPFGYIFLSQSQNEIQRFTHEMRLISIFLLSKTECTIKAPMFLYLTNPWLNATKKHYCNLIKCYIYIIGCHDNQFL